MIVERDVPADEFMSCTGRCEALCRHGGQCAHEASMIRGGVKVCGTRQFCAFTAVRRPFDVFVSAVVDELIASR